MTCDKQTYNTIREANIAASNLKKHRKDRHQYRAYKCDVCTGYHITTITKTLRDDHIPKRFTKYPIKVDEIEIKPAWEPKPKKQKKEKYFAPIQITTGRFLSPEQAMALKQIINGANKR